MARRPRGATFAEIVRQVRDAPVVEVEDVPLLEDPDGRGFFLIDDDIAPERAQALLADGALVAWDSCGGLGCGSRCPVDWFDPAERARMLRAGPPLLGDAGRERGHLLELVGADGQRLVLAMVDVRWGDLMYRR